MVHGADLSWRNPVREQPPRRKREINRALRAFSKCSAGADAAVIYCTGHGIHCQGETFLLPCDYPVARGYSEARVLSHAVSVESLAHACQAQDINAVFFAGCRTRCDAA